MRDVLGWSAKETAEVLDTSAASVESALQRARATMARNRPASSEQWAPASPPDAEERALLQRYIDAHHRADTAAVVALLREDVRFTMPPEPVCYAGAEVARFFETEVFGPGGIGEFRLVATRASRQPAAANYIRAWDEDVFRAVTLDVLRIEDGLIREITTFDSGMFAMFGLPAARGRVRHRARGDRR